MFDRISYLGILKTILIIFFKLIIPKQVLLFYSLYSTRLFVYFVILRNKLTLIF